MAERRGLGEVGRAVVYRAGLLARVGCHTDAHEQAKWFGDDLTLEADVRRVDGPRPRDRPGHVGAGRPFPGRVRLGAAPVRAARERDGADVPRLPRTANALGDELGGFPRDAR
jgi:hypothetical protein